MVHWLQHGSHGKTAINFYLLNGHGRHHSYVTKIYEHIKVNLLTNMNVANELGGYIKSQTHNNRFGLWPQAAALILSLTIRHTQEKNHEYAPPPKKKKKKKKSFLLHHVHSDATGYLCYYMYRRWHSSDLYVHLTYKGERIKKHT